MNQLQRKLKINLFCSDKLAQHPYILYLYIEYLYTNSYSPEKKSFEMVLEFYVPRTCI